MTLLNFIHASCLAQGLLPKLMRSFIIHVDSRMNNSNIVQTLKTNSRPTDPPGIRLSNHGLHMIISLSVEVANRRCPLIPRAQSR